MIVRELVQALVEYPMDAQVKVYHQLGYNININSNLILPKDCYRDCVRLDIDFPSNNFIIRRKTEEELNEDE